MPSNRDVSEHGPTKKKGEISVREAAELERQATDGEIEPARGEHEPPASPRADAPEQGQGE